MTDSRVPAHIADNPRLGTWLSVTDAQRRGPRREGRAGPGHRHRARPDRRGRLRPAARVDPHGADAHRARPEPGAHVRQPVGRADRTRAATPRRRGPHAHRGTGGTGLRVRRPDPRSSDPDTDLTGDPAGAAGTGARGRPQRVPASTSPTRCSVARATSPTCDPRDCCTAGCCARRRSAPGWWSSPRTGRRREWSWCATGRSSAWSASARPTSTARSTSSSATARGRSATCCPTRTTSRPGSGPDRTKTIPVREEEPAPGAHTASYSKPFLVHASIAPSCGMARWDEDGLRVWSHSQGIHGLRAAIAAALGARPGVGPGGARRERRLLRPQRRRRRGVRRRAAGPVHPRAAGADPLVTARRAHLGTALLGDDCHRLRGSRRRPDHRLDVRRVEPGPHVAPRVPGHPRPARGSPPRRTDPAPPADRPPDGTGRRDHPQRRSALCGRTASDHRPPEGADAVADLRDAGARRLPQRVRHRELHGRAGRGGGRRPGAVPARPPRGRASAPRRRDRGRPLRLGRATPRRDRPRPRLRALQGHRRLVRRRRRGRGRAPTCGSAG